MKVLFDQGTQVPLRDHIQGHQIDTVYERGWSQLRNGELLTNAEQDGYQAFITTDQNLKYQQSLKGRMIAVVVLRSTSWPRIQRKIGDVQHVIDSLARGGYVEIDI